MSQLTLDLFPDVSIEPTIALAQGDSVLDQCGYCGTLVCRPSGAAVDITARMGACPACGQTKHGWSRQTLGIGPFKKADDLRAWTLWQHCNAHLLNQGQSPQIVRIVLRVGQWVIYRVEHTPNDQTLVGRERCDREDMFRDLFPTQVTEDHLQAIPSAGGKTAA
jgi:hypothetical protein